LITMSNLVGCSTGKSCGFVPFSIFQRLRGEPQILLLCVTISASGAGVVGARAFVPYKIMRAT